MVDTRIAVIERLEERMDGKNGTANEGNCQYDRENWILRNLKK